RRTSSIACSATWSRRPIPSAPRWWAIFRRAAGSAPSSPLRGSANPEAASVESAELIAILREVRDRVRARNPETAAGGGIPLPDLLPLVHARDAALGKVAAIGTVNPRPGGLANSLVQGWKKFVARVLDWHVREQVEFNRKMVTCIDSAIEALTETNRAISKIGGLVDGSEEIRRDWVDWRAEWQRKLQQTEIQFLRSAADLQCAFQHRVTVLDSGYRESLRLQHTAFTAELDLKTAEIQKR